MLPKKHNKVRCKLWFTDLISTVILRLPLSISLLPKPVILFIIKVSSFHLFIVDNIKKYFNTKCSLIHRLLNINLHIKLLITTANYINFTLTIQDNIYKMCLSLMYFFVFRLRTVRPAAGNRTARNWQPHGPQLENGVLVDA